MVLVLKFLRCRSSYFYIEFSSFVADLFIIHKAVGVVSMTSICGMQSLKFENAPYLKGWASVAGQKEGRSSGKSDPIRL